MSERQERWLNAEIVHSQEMITKYKVELGVQADYWRGRLAALILVQEELMAPGMEED